MLLPVLEGILPEIGENFPSELDASEAAVTVFLEWRQKDAAPRH